MMHPIFFQLDGLRAGRTEAFRGSIFRIQVFAHSGRSFGFRVMLRVGYGEVRDLQLSPMVSKWSVDTAPGLAMTRASE